MLFYFQKLDNFSRRTILFQEKKKLEGGDGDGEVKNDPEVDAKEKEAIKQRYLGAERRKKRIRRQNDRKFIFDWENTDDTSGI